MLETTQGESGSDAYGGNATMKRDWVKAIGKKLREDLGDCPTLPRELVDALDRLEQARQASSLDGETSFSNASAATKRGKQDLMISLSGHRANISRYA
jgi:hypothetical protein